MVKRTSPRRMTSTRFAQRRAVAKDAMDATKRPLSIPPEMGLYAEKVRLFQLMQVRWRPVWLGPSGGTRAIRKRGRRPLWGRKRNVSLRETRASPRGEDFSQHAPGQEWAEFRTLFGLTSFLRSTTRSRLESRNSACRVRCKLMV